MVTNFEPLIVGECDGIPYKNLHTLKNIHVTVVVVNLAESSDHFTIEYLSVIITAC